MVNLGIVTNPIEFIDQVAADTPNSELPEMYIPVLRVYLYYIWRGAFESRRRILQNKVQGDLGLLCMSVYKGLVPVIQLVRLGHGGDALILLRTAFERIALLGYLESNPSQIAKYKRSKNLLSDANNWAKAEWKKDKTTENIFRMYGNLSKLVHPTATSTAGHIVADQSVIGRAFRQYMKPEEGEEVDFYEAGVIGLLFIIRIADLAARNLFKKENYIPFLEDRDCLTYLSHEDLEQSLNLFQRLIGDGAQK